MPSLTIPGRMIWFAHCPKAGGTSIEQFMVAHWGPAVGHLHWGWDLWWKGGGWRRADPPNSPQHLVWEDALRLLPGTPDRVFALVRDPASRLASEYRWQRRGRRGTRLGRALAYLPFPVWLRLMLALAARYPYAMDNHLRPQADFVPEDARVFRLEEGIEPAIHWLLNETGRSPDASVPHAIPTGTGPCLRAADSARIALAFAEDYARFGYPKPPARFRTGPGDLLAMCLAPLLAFADRRGAL